MVFEMGGSKMFQVGDKIAHPMHGAGIVDSIVTNKVNGVARDYYILKLPMGGMVVMVPTATSEAIGVRAVIAPQQAEQIIAAIPSITVDMTPGWNQRYRENMTRLKSGDLLEVAQVVKGLSRRDDARGLSTGERKMLHTARQILVSELVMAKDSTYEEMEQRVNAALAH